MGAFRKQLFYLTNDQLTTYQGEKGNYSAGLSFPNDETGWEAFSRHLAGSQNTPTYLLADLIEEDFQLDSLPHVLGRSRRALIQRRLGQLYRDTPYRQAVQQGREEFGRKDDQMLFSALTNVELLKPWLNALMKQKVPLTGIYSPALLSTTLIKKLDLVSDNLLLVTHQASGLRQSFFQGSALKFSRLTTLPDHNPDTVADTTARETANTQQFLASARLLPRGKTLDAVILTHGESLQMLQSACHDTPALAHRFLDLTDAATQLGLKNPGSVTLCDPLFLSLLGATPASHYAQTEQTRYYSLWQARLVLYILSAGVVTGALLSAGANGLEALQHYRQSQQIAIETSLAQSQYQTIIRSLPHTAASPQDMKAAVNIEQMISRNAPAPTQLLGTVSRALDILPQIRIDQLHWRVSTEAETTDNPADPQQHQPVPGVAEPAPSSVLIGIPKKPNQILLIEGEVVSLRQDYRTALESVRLFAAELGKNKLLRTEITRPPLDIKPSVKLTGNAGVEETDTKTRFIMKLTLRPES
ncbi:hypothetical protein SCD_n00569 [Sulfuricella denitrificans skB26]|uniref:Uncharacterized protein n=1 Tax=Sulfuricella denitrificans (strain DSM 22764 / NBRC 105220 / skB26) TaxID=1163617 RepID=S6AF04_SULDS|nr:hypothetical protein [Sulfuricella denitrificans]BAN34416.1 hypothetical protein SCD_n00569 [Sulfuricella denitrificans skB26]